MLEEGKNTKLQHSCKYVKNQMQLQKRPWTIVACDNQLHVVASLLFAKDKSS